MAGKLKSDRRYLSFHIVSTNHTAIFTFLLYFIFVFSIAWLAGEELFSVFIGFSAVFLYLLITFLLFYFNFAIPEIVYLIPIISAIGFYAAWNFALSSSLSQMNGPMLTVLNIVVSYVFAALLSIIHPHKISSSKINKLKIDHPEPILANNEDEEISFENTHSSHRNSKIIEEEEKIETVTSNKIIEDKPMSVTIRGIEDKSKALNFAIGRVYSAKRGGSKEIRQMIGIPKELYNAFSDLVHDDDIVDAEKLLTVVSQISHRLSQMKKKESSLFDLNEAKIEVERAEDGSDTVLEVLARNDKDPVEEYHAEAQEVCKQVIQYLKSM